MAAKKSVVSKAVKSTRAGKRVQEKDLQAALYQIADAASAVTDMQSFYVRLHKIVGTLMYAENFFIAVHDPQTDLITWPYYVDTVDIERPEPIALKDQHGGTGWILRTGRTLSHAEGTVSYIIEHGEAEQTGTVSDAIGVPLKSDGKTVGVLLIQSYREEIKYNLQHVEIMNFVAQHIAIALTRARAIEETRQRNSELAIINSVQAALAAQVDIHGIYAAVGEKLREIFNYQDVGVYSTDLKTRTVTIEYAFEKGRKFEQISVPMNSMYEYVVAANKTFVFNGNIPEFVAQFKDYQVPVGELPKSGVFVPIPRKMDADLSVYLILEDIDGTRFFSESDVRLLQTLANSMSVALENACLFDEVQKRNQEITEALEQQTATSEILSVLASSPTELQPVLDAIAERAAKICDSEACQIRLIEREHLVVASNYGDDRQFSVGNLVSISRQTVSGRAVIDREMIHIPDLFEVFDEYPLIANRARQTGNEAWLVAPLLREGVAIGTIHIRRFRVHPFTEKQMSQFKIFADQAVIAIENVRLFTETQHLLKETEDRAAELAILNSVGEAMAKTLDVKTVTRIVGNKVRDIFSADQMGILLFERQTNLIHILYGYDKAHDRYIDGLQIKPIPFGKGLTSKVIELSRPLLLSTREEQDGYGHYMPPELKGQIKMSESWLGVPIMADEDVIGVVFVEDYRPHAYNENHLRLLQTLSANMGVAMQNARLFEETQQRNAELAIINSVQEGLASKLVMQEIYELVGEKLREVFKTHVVDIVDYDPANNLISMPYSYEKGDLSVIEPREPYGFRKQVIETCEPLLINQNFIELASQVSNPLLTGTWPKSALFVPLLVDGRVRSIISIQDLDRENAYSASDVQLLQTLSNAMSVALENARLWEQEKMFRKALQRELDIGREIQAGFLPEALPVVDGWEIAASLMSAREVAGDFYDVFALPDGSIGLVIADVCDKGVGAALFMTLFRSLVRAAANLDYYEHTGQSDAPHSSSERLQRAIALTNNYIAETHGESGMFATLFFGILDPRDGRLLYVNGGHEAPLIVRAGAVRESLRNTGPAVGVRTNARFRIVETCMQPGDAFFAFTDGVPDCQNPRGEFFGRDRLLDFIQQRRDSAPGLVAEMEAELRQYIAGANQFDDITLLAVRMI